MDWSNYITSHIPSIIRGVTGLAAARVALPDEREDVTPKFIARRLGILNSYQEKLEQAQRDFDRAEVARLAVPDIAKIPAPSPTRHVGECPYCKLEEVAGIVRNHLLFVAQECKQGKLGPATGGMIPQAKEATEEFIQRVNSLDGPPHLTILAHLGRQTAQELLPKLEWIEDCEEANEAATLADEMWHRAAKTTQLYYAKGTTKPYA